MEGIMKTSENPDRMPGTDQLQTPSLPVPAPRMNATIEPMPRPTRLPLSYAQQSLWFINKLKGTSSEYNLLFGLKLKGELNAAFLERAVNTIAARHESLRTRFEEIDGEPVQIIDPKLQVSMPIEDLSRLDEPGQTARVLQSLRDEGAEPFDLSRGPLLRVRLLKLSEMEHVFVETMHHITVDGWSWGVFHRELLTIYDAYQQGRGSPLEPLTIQYADFTLWQRNRVESGRLNEGFNYWKKQLEGIPERLELPVDHAHRVEMSPAEVKEAMLPAEQTAALKQLSREHQATLYMSLLAAFAVLLSRYSGQDDIVVGTPIANRQDPKLEKLIGIFVNTLVMRVRIAPDRSFRKLLNEVTQTTWDAYQHKDVPVDRLVEAIAPQRSIDYTPLFQVALALQSMPFGLESGSSSLEVEPMIGDAAQARWDLEVHIWETGAGLNVRWLYNRDVFEPWRIEQMAKHYITVLNAAIARPEDLLRDIDVLSREEQQHILYEWNNTRKDVPETTLVELFQQQAAMTPGAVAVAHYGREMTYSELDTKSSQLANYLQEQGLRPEGIVGIALPRSLEMIIAMVGILKAGGAYLPLDTAYPVERLSLMIADVSPKFLFCERNLGAVLAGRNSNLITLDVDHAIQMGSASSFPLQLPNPRNAAYLIYTSGSTGKPKGIAIEHRNATAFLFASESLFSPAERAEIMAATSISFDLSVFEIFLPLCRGGKVVLAQNVLDVANAARTNRPTLLFMVPSAATELVRTGAIPQSVQVVCLGAEPVSSALVNSIYAQAHARVMDIYGPSETTTFSTFAVRKVDGPETIGRPILNTQIYLLDSNLWPAPVGVAGEVYIAGHGVARNYVNRPRLTAERFVANPWGEPGARMYRTGDLARWTPDGTLQFLGRSDDQVKIRGFRIELAEIQATLQQHPRVRDAAVIVRDDGTQKSLLGYVTRAESQEEQDEARKSQITQWQQLYDSIYTRSQDTSGAFNIVGWMNSYTGQPIAPEEMKIWVEETVARIRTLQAKKVVEIGCGTGLLLTRLAADCACYTGVDFSPIVLRQLAAYLSSRPDLLHVELRHGLAHDLSFLADGSVDLVIVNSVVQYFPEIHYLVGVLREAVRVTRNGGHIFIGDVRSLPLMEAYHTSVHLHKAGDETTVSELRRRIAQALRDQEELLVAPRLFEEVGRQWPRVGRVTALLKAGAYDNELSRFRYDVLIRAGEKEEIVDPQRWISWSEDGSWKTEVEKTLHEAPGSSVGVRGLPDARAARAVKAVELLAHSPAEMCAGELQAAVQSAAGEDPDAVMALARKLGVEINWQRFGSDGIYDAVFNPQWRRISRTDHLAAADYERFANTPAKNTGDGELVQELKTWLGRKLPDYMVPPAIVVLPRLPLKPNGKVDRQKLPLPDLNVRTTSYRAPRTPEEEILCEAFAQLLAVDRVGVDDDFFALGGHSLMATRLVSRIRTLLGVDIQVGTVFEAPSVAKLATKLHGARSSRVPLEPKLRPEHLPLSYGQQRLWFLDKLKGSSTEYTIPVRLRLSGKLDAVALERAINTIVERHETLRTHFRETDGRPEQIIAPQVLISMPTEDLRGLDKQAQSRRVTEILEQEGTRPFDLSQGPFLRVRLLRLGEHEHVLLRTVHHIASDGWSEGIFNRELAEIYDAYRQGKESPLKPLSVQYADFTLWQREWLQEEWLDNELAYWKQQLAGIPGHLELCTDRPRPALQTFEAELCPVRLNSGTTGNLKRFSQSRQATLYMTMLAAFGVLLSRYSGQEDIVVASPIANRQEPQLEALIGFFVNTLVLRMGVQGGKSFRNLLGEVHGMALAAYQHQDVPFERLVEELAPRRSLQTSPVFQVMFSLHNMPLEVYQLQGLEIEVVRGDYPQVIVDLEVYAVEQSGAIEIYWVYNRDLFDRWRMEQMARHFVHVLEATVANPNEAVGQMQLLDEKELRHILEEFNRTEHHVPEVTLPELFEEQARRIPRSTAIIDQGKELNYEELNRRANRLAHWLIAEGIGPEDLVAVAIPRSSELIAALLGILKCGAACLPLDAYSPAQRLAFMLEDAQPACVLTVSGFASRLAGNTRQLVLDRQEALDDLFCYPVSNPENADRRKSLAPENPAYVIYTSGSTGNPKGVLVPHSAIVNKISTLISYLGLTRTTRYAAITATIFDPLFEQVFCPLCAGGTSIIIPDSVRDDAEQFSAYARELKPSVLDITPGLAELLIRQSNWTLRLDTLIVGGDVLPASLANELRSSRVARRIFNFYGPTEACIDATACEISGAPLSRSVSIGSALPNYRLYVLDGGMQPVPAGVVGELYIAGAGLARGYLKRPALTAERFLPDPYGEPGTQMYCTGDLAWWRRDGNLEFIGRRDHQVKIRGFRIELGEIEAALQAFPEVAQAVVIAREDAPGDKLLVGYVVAAAGESVDGAVLRQKLGERLPDYMVPAAIVRLEALPLTANGKLDRKALPAPELIPSAGWRAPRTPQEEILCALFAEVLNLERVGIDDNFFEIGGHSLLATLLVSRIRATLVVEIQPSALFEWPTVAELSPHLRKADRERNALVRQPRPERLPLSYAQQRLWFLDRLGGGSTEYNVPATLRLRGALDKAALEKAVQMIVARHESLRTHFEEVDGAPVQVIAKEVRMDLAVEDLTMLELEEDTQKEQVRAELAQQWREPFDLEQGPLLRVKLLKLGEEDHLLLRTIHHIVYDGWSEGVFNRELVGLYEAFRTGRENPLPELAVQYADFTLWQREWMQEEWLKGELGYWRQQLAGIPERLELCTDHPRPAVQTFKAELCHVKLNTETAGKLKQLSQSQQATLYMTLLAAFGVLLARYSGQEDIVVGSPIANRQEAELEELIGFFVNSLVLRMGVKAGISFQELLGEVRRTALEAYQHQDVPFERLVEELSPQRSLNTTPLFQVVFAYQNAPWLPQAGQGLRLEPVLGEELRVRFDLEVHAQEQAGEIETDWVYNKDLFDRWRIQQMAGHFIRVLELVVENPEQSIKQLPLLSQEEEQQLRSWNRQPVEYPRATLAQRFEQQAQKRGPEIALVCGKEQLSYQELNRRANQLGHYLRDMGVKEETAVGICMPRSVAMVVGILGILKAGGAYVPLDERYPEERLRHMVKDAGIEVVVTGSKLKELWSNAGVRCVDVDAEREEIARQPETNVDSNGTSESLAYIIYTSGSTGLPKGTAVPHRSFFGFMCDVDYVVFNEKQVLFQHSSTSWDAAALELWPALVHGGKCVLHAGESASPQDLRKAIKEHGVTLLWLTSALFNSIIDSDPRGLAGVKQLLVGGEALSASHIDKALRFLPETQIVNGYGPSECTVFTTCYPFSRENHPLTSIPIGRPIGDRQVFLLDGNLNQVPAGVPGEIVVGGPAVARCYVGRPQLTAEKFIPHPFSQQPGARLYRTGDLAWWRSDGNLEFIGRRDHQVKIRGFRIELGEIEAALQAFPEVAQAVVIAREDAPGDKRLVGYVVAAAGESVDGAVLRQKLGERLPDHMVPAAIVRLEALPLTANGKLDRKALPAPELIPSAGWRAPRTPQEEILCALFAEVLNLERVGIDDNFFEIGGHSLLATLLVSRIRATLAVEIQPSALFEWPTVAELSPHLRKADRERKALVRQPRPERLPLSYAQQRLWFLDRLGSGSTEYNVPATLRLRGTLDKAALEKALRTIVARHESLRTHFEEVDGAPVQVIAREVRIELAVEDLTMLELEEDTQKEQVRAELAQQWREKFDLGQGPLLRVKLLKLGEEDHLLLRTIHHIVYDGWSEGVFNRELVGLYEAFRTGRENPLPELAVQYADFTLWQREWMQEEWLKGELGYWKQQLAGIPERLELCTDRPRPAVQSFGAELLRARLSARATGRLKQLSQSQQGTLYMTLLAGFGVLLARYSGQEDIVVGSPIANRQEAELEELIGFFVNSLVLRMGVKAGMSFEELLGQVRRTALEAYQHQDVPFERLVEELSPQRSLNTTPLFQVVFAYQNAPWLPQAGQGLRLEPMEGEELRVRFDLEVHAQEQDGEIETDWIYNTDLFDRWRVQQMAHHFLSVLEAVAGNPQLEIRNIDVLGANERRQVLEEWNRTRRDYPRAACLPELVEERAERTPGAIAVICAGKELNYHELNCRANQLARYLVQQGVEAETRVGICVERSIEMVIGLLGILKAGGAYVPLEPAYPDERLKMIVKDAEVRFLVTEEHLSERFTDQPVQHVDLERDWKIVAQHSPENLPPQVSPDNAAYVIYTSGSTGKPKGVAVTHRSLQNLFNAVDENLRFSHNDVWTMFHSYSFDFSAWEIWGALIYGGRLVIVPYLIARTPEEFCDLVYQEGVTILSQTPSAFQHFIRTNELAGAGKRLNLRAVIFGGEMLEFQGLERWFARYGDEMPQMINMYGITETTVHTTWHRVRRENLAGTSGSLIGGPLANIRTYVLNEHLQPAPVGVLGELYVGGEGLARGYLNLPRLTAERFVADPFAEPGARMYRSGDLARWTKDGNLEFAGRADQQVKIRGFRIEPGEIEAALQEFPEVAQAVVIAREGSNGEKQLLGYVVPAPGSTVDPVALRHELARQLPDYMVPAAIMQLEKIPLTTNGKLDKSALPKPEFQPSQQSRVPRTAQEETLCSLFKEVLGLDQVAQVGIDDSFFEIGGHSLLAMRLVSRIRATLGTELSIRNLFEAPTVAGLAGRIEKPVLTDPYEIILPLRMSGSRLPLFCIHPALGLSSGYSALLRHLDATRPVYGVQARGLNQPGQLPRSIAEMAREYLAHIRGVQPRGPYHLLGWSFGGCVAQAIASLARQEGEEIAILALLDAFPADQYGQAEEPPEAYLQSLIAANPEMAGMIDDKHRPRVLEIISNNVMLHGQRESFLYSGDAMLFVATAEHDEHMLAGLWQPYIDGEIKTFAVACGHQEMLRPASIARIGQRLNQELETLYQDQGLVESVTPKDGIMFGLQG